MLDNLPLSPSSTLHETKFQKARVILSGSGNVAQYAALKLIELGSTVLSLSDSTGALIAKDAEKGFTVEDISAIASLKIKHAPLTEFVQLSGNESKFTWHAGARPWALVDNVDIALPCATQNEVSGEEAEALLKAGVKIVAEGSNMGCTLEAIEVFEKSRREGGQEFIWYAPGSTCFLAPPSISPDRSLPYLLSLTPSEASNCGGVAVSGLEMAQNSARLTWAPVEVDAKLKSIMENCYEQCFDTGKEYTAAGGKVPSLVVGANISGFIKV